MSYTKLSRRAQNTHPVLDPRNSFYQTAQSGRIQGRVGEAFRCTLDKVINTFHLPHYWVPKRSLANTNPQEIQETLSSSDELPDDLTDSDFHWSDELSSLDPVNHSTEKVHVVPYNGVQTQCCNECSRNVFPLMERTYELLKLFKLTPPMARTVELESRISDRILHQKVMDTIQNQLNRKRRERGIGGQGPLISIEELGGLNEDL